MTNEQRREALDEARRKAYIYAKDADDNHRGVVGSNANSRRMAEMWAAVAESLKVGSGHDTDGVLWSHERGRI